MVAQLLFEGKAWLLSPSRCISFAFWFLCDCSCYRTVDVHPCSEVPGLSYLRLKLAVFKVQAIVSLQPPDCFRALRRSEPWSPRALPPNKLSLIPLLPFQCGRILSRIWHY